MPSASATARGTAPKRHCSSPRHCRRSQRRKSQRAYDIRAISRRKRCCARIGRTNGQAGLASPASTSRPPRGAIFDSSIAMAEAVAQGLGVALVPPAMFSCDLAGGRLIRPFDAEIAVGSYWLTALKSRRTTAGMQIFRTWLLATLEPPYRAQSDNVIGQLLFFDLLFGDDAVPDRHAGAMDGVAPAGDEMVPPVKLLPLGQQPIGAGAGHEGQVGDIRRGDLHAIRYQLLPVLVASAATAERIEQVAGDIRMQDRPGILVLQLDQTAFAASVAERFPLRIGHLGQSFRAPERLLGHRGPKPR